MKHTIEPAGSGRAKCRGCGRTIAKGDLRFGERLSNPFAEGREMTHWFHLTCGAMKRPEVFLETILGGEVGSVPEGDTLRKIAEDGVAHRRLPRIDGGERASSGRATCRNCREPIPKDEWRVKLVFWEEGMFNPAGYIHLTCSGEYFETTDIADRLGRFSPELAQADLSQIRELLSPDQ